MHKVCLHISLSYNKCLRRKKRHKIKASCYKAAINCLTRNIDIKEKWFSLILLKIHVNIKMIGTYVF